MLCATDCVLGWRCKHLLAWVVRSFWVCPGAATSTSREMLRLIPRQGCRFKFCFWMPISCLVLRRHDHWARQSVLHLRVLRE